MEYKFTDDSKELRFGPGGKALLNGGLCLEEPSSISISQSPDMKNMCADDGGMLIKRPGQAYVYPTSLGTGKINGIYADFKGKTVIAWGTALYTQVGTDQPVQIYSGIANAKAFLFPFNGSLYLINGTDFLKYDGSTVSAVTPYIPKISINRKPDGTASTDNESWNMIGSGFTDQFVGDGTSTVYKLSFTGLDATGVTAVANGTTYTEGSGITVNRTTGEVTFSSAPPKNDLMPNNVLITAYKTFPANPLVIKKCTFAMEFSNRMFFSGNPDSPNCYYASGVTDSIDCSYFPKKYSYAIRGADKKVTGFCVTNNRLVVFKEDLTAAVDASTGLDNLSSFPISYLNTEIGCDIPDSIQLINDVPVFANSYGGVYVIVSTVIPGEKSFKLVSRNINGDTMRPGLLQQDTTNLKAAVSVNHGGKYYLCINGNCYVWDYRRNFSVSNTEELIWLYYTNINATCFAIRDNVLMYGHNANGLLCKFVDVANDFGSGIDAYWKSKLFDFGYPDMLKNISYMWITTRANSSSAISINLYSDKGESLAPQTIPSGDLKSFRWDTFRWDTLNWMVQIFSPTMRIKLKIKKVRYFQVKMSNSNSNENLSVIGLVIKYILSRKVR